MSDEWMDLAIMGLGAGSKGLVVGFVSGILPSLTGDIAGLISGGLVYAFGDRVHPALRKFGAGILISSIGGLVEGMVSGLMPTTAKASNVVPENQTSLQALAAAEAQKTVDSRILI